LAARCASWKTSARLAAWGGAQIYLEFSTRECSARGTKREIAHGKEGEVAPDNRRLRTAPQRFPLASSCDTLLNDLTFCSCFSVRCWSSHLSVYRLEW